MSLQKKKRKPTKRQTTAHKTQHTKLIIKQHEPDQKLKVISYALVPMISQSFPLNRMEAVSSKAGL